MNDSKKRIKSFIELNPRYTLKANAELIRFYGSDWISWNQVQFVLNFWKSKKEKQMTAEEIERMFT